ncbi:CRISPR-associated endonuclease Cas3'' [Streptomyces sp. NPDC001820]|uniref:CRISPR-associated endonuclease Cas3'' n=1 Tax=Streptomyces sp. NPDC001820 TaxID=3364613 RepID=UPI0036980E64
MGRTRQLDWVHVGWRAGELGVFGVGVVEDGRFGGLELCVWGKFHRGYGVAYPVLFHMLDVAAVAGELWDRFLTGSQRAVISRGLGVGAVEARGLVMFWAGCHDVGKVSRYQACEPAAWARVSDALQADTGSWQLMRHERASMHAALEILAGFGYRLEGNASPAVRVAQILGGHHGRFLQVDMHGAASWPRVHADLGGPRWRDLRLRYAAQIRHLTGAYAVPPRVSAEAAVLISGLVMVADRLASQPRVWLPRAMSPAFGAAEHYASTQLPASSEATGSWAAQVVTESGLQRIDLPDVPFTQAHRHVPGPNRLQASVPAQLEVVVKEEGPGIVLVTDATGGGKTITALEAARIFNAHCATRGVAWLLPTTAIADAMYETLEAYVAAHRPERAPVALVHNHSWLNAAYHDRTLAEAGQQLTLDEHFTGDPDQEGEGRPERKVTVPDGWLRGYDRALLAQFTVATLDQALMAVLSTRYNALRMLALSGRTVVIDEAHDYSRYTQRLLQRLLHWLGALRVPVVILSATLPAHVGRELVRAYLAGAGHGRLADADFHVPYPGWLFAAARDASCTRIDPGERAAHISEHRRTAAVHTRPVEYRMLGEQDRLIAPGERLALIRDEIAKVAASGGCAAVECATVADAQDTYLYLKHTLNWPCQEEELVLLHARFPGHERGAVMRRLRTALGPRGPRPGRLVVVTTSLLDMSLDIDVDVMVSDLASLARLLQRMGRLWRFEQAWQHHRPMGVGERPEWIKARRPRLTVLDPTHEGRTELPASWATGESAFLLHTTGHLLRQDPARRLMLPDQVQELIEQVHGTGADAAHLSAMPAGLQSAHQAQDRAEEHLGDDQLIPPPSRVGSLADLYRQPLTAGRAATRTGARPRRVLACYRQRSGRLTLDPAGSFPLPYGPHLRPGQIRSLLERTVSVPDAWVAGGEHPAIPDAWRQHPLLAGLVLLITETERPGPARFGRHLLRLDTELGLVHSEG